MKIINFCITKIKIRKNFRLAAGPLPGVALSGEQPPAARVCAGAKSCDFCWVFNVTYSHFKINSLLIKSENAHPKINYVTRPSWNKHTTRMEKFPLGCQWRYSCLTVKSPSIPDDEHNPMSGGGCQPCLYVQYHTICIIMRSFYSFIKSYRSHSHVTCHKSKKHTGCHRSC